MRGTKTAALVLITTHKVFYIIIQRLSNYDPSQRYWVIPIWGSNCHRTSPKDIESLPHGVTQKGFQTTWDIYSQGWED